MLLDSDPVVPPLPVDLRPGNVGGCRVLDHVARRLQAGPIRLLDIGCVGPRPMRFWAPLMRKEEAKGLDFTGIDVGGIEEARQYAQQAFGSLEPTLIEYDGYDLLEAVGSRRFDVVTANQVLEHVAKPRVFLEQVSQVLEPGGEFLLTFDSAHRAGKIWYGFQLDSVKNVTKWILARFGREAHYDLALYDHEFEAHCQAVGFEVVSKRFVNLHFIKPIHNQQISHDFKELVLDSWVSFEECLHADASWISENKSLFCGIHYHCRKRS